MSQLTQAVRRSPRRARLAAGAVLVALAALMLVWIGHASADTSSTAAVSASGSNIATGRADAVHTSFPQACTCSPNFVDMPGMSETFSFGGTASRPVLVLFQAEWEAFVNGAQVTIRLKVDGVIHSPDVRVAVIHGTSGFNFVTAPLSPGTHTATIQWRDNGVGPVYASDRSLIVLHK